MTALEKDASWASAKKEMADSSFLNKLLHYDAMNIKPSVLKKLEKFTKMERFMPEYVNKVSMAAGALCAWIRAIESIAKQMILMRSQLAKAQVEGL